MSSKENLKESALYHRKENPIMYKRQFTEKLKCGFDLSFFPFDTQPCSISFNVKMKESHLVNLVGNNVEFIGNRKLSTFDVIRSELDEDDIADGIDVKVNIKLKRQISQHILSINLPSLIIMIIAQIVKLWQQD